MVDAWRLGPAYDTPRCRHRTNFLHSNKVVLVQYIAHGGQPPTAPLLFALHMDQLTLTFSHTTSLPLLKCGSRPGKSTREHSGSGEGKTPLNGHHPGITVSFIAFSIQYFLHPGFKGIICKSLSPSDLWLVVRFSFLSSFKDPLINKNAHVLVVWPWKYKNSSCKAAN
jgi:hypothetical protein